MSITSYAQNFEDIMLWRALGQIENGFYIDIGAHDPIIVSVSLAFHEHGWHGIHVEATPYYAELLRLQRPGDTVIQAAVGKGAVKKLPFFEIPDTGISTADPAIAQQHRERGFDVREITVPCVSLSAVFKMCAGSEIHWLKMDVEGFEKQELSSWGKSVARPWIVVVESTLPLTQIETHETWESILIGYGYFPVYFDGLNRYYISDAHPELKDAFLAPPNIFDGFSLNGTSSAPFHQLIKARFQEKISEALAQSEQQEQAATNEIKRLTLSLGALDKTLAEYEQKWIQREQAVAQQLQSRQQELHRLEQDRTQREKEHADQTSEIRQSLESLLRTQAQREQEVTAQLLAIQQQAHLEIAEQAKNHSEQERVSLRQHTEREQALAQQLQSRQQELHRLEQDRVDMQHQLDIQLRDERESSQQMQQAINALQVELATMRNGLFWRLTTPIRVVIGWFKPVLTQTRYVKGTGEQPVVMPMSQTNRMISNHSTQVTQPTLSSTATNLKTLLQYQDQQFVEYAYMALLKRQPDTEGFNYYLGRLRGGIPKVQILGQIIYSREAQTNGVELLGLRDAVKRQKLADLPLVGAIFKLFTKAEGNSAFESRLRAFEQQAFLSIEQSDAHFERIDHGVNNLQQLIVQQGQQFMYATRQVSLPISNPISCESIVPSTGVTESESARLDVPPAHASKQLTAAYSKGQPIPTEQIVLPLAAGQRTLYYYVDHTVQCATNTGMQRVTRRLAGSLLAAGERVIFVKLDTDRRELVLVSREELDHLSKWSGPHLPPAEAALYQPSCEERKVVSPHNLGEGCWLVVPEVTHITYHSDAVTLDLFATARRNGLRTVFVYYDAIPLRRREHASAAGRHEIYTQQLLLADLIVPISQWSSRDLVSFFREHDHATLSPIPTITKIHLPGESQLTARVTESIAAHQCDHMILSVGSIEPHKNQVALLHAFETFCVKYPNTDWQLFLAGNLHPDVSPEITRATKQFPNIRYLQHVSDQDLDALYRRCTFTVFPSIEEGFGLPILESLWYAKPCVCANFGAMKEVAEGGGCVMVDTRNETAILVAIESLTGSPKLLNQLSREAVMRPFTDWSDYANQLTAAMDSIISPITNLGPIYYWVDHTCSYHANSGIQRVVRGLARALVKLGVELIPVKWDAASQSLAKVSFAECEHLSLWNGPPASGWSSWRDPHQSGGWILIPELTTCLPEPNVPGLREFVSSAGLRCAWVFYDAIPWKMRNIYPMEATIAHKKYMAGLNQHELVLAISQFSLQDLMEHLGQEPLRTPSLFERIVPCHLPGEFLESPRIFDVKQPHSQHVRILCVGTVEHRKNHLVVLEAFKKLMLMTDISVDLVIAGGAPFPELADKVEGYIKHEPRVRWEKSASDTDLRHLYSECDFTVYASSEEGFGLPILESLWQARPCVCAAFGAMEEVARGGGCVLTDVRDADQLATAMRQLVEDEGLRQRLGIEATMRQFKTWRDYAQEVALRMSQERYVPRRQKLPETLEHRTFYDQFVNIRPRPKLSICITTYNRAAWLEVNLRNLARLWPTPDVDVEIVVCDNASTDHTSAVVNPYLGRADFNYIRNAKNVGMLGNLRVTASHARGEYVWILGDDDLVLPGTIERVLKKINDHAGTALVYLNYSYTRLDDAGAVSDLDKFLLESTPILAPGQDKHGTIREICAQSENFFTAIYCLVFRRDHALRAYTQNTDGRPFSTLLTCIPTTYYVLNNMMDEQACWIGEPMLVVNMNVSWMKYAPLWILERIPEVHDLAERLGADRFAIDRWRRSNLPGVVHFLKEIFENDNQGNIDYFSMQRLVSRLKGLKGIEEFIEQIQSVYRAAHEAGHLAARTSAEKIFAAFDSKA